MLDYEQGDDLLPASQLGSVEMCEHQLHQLCVRSRSVGLGSDHG